MAVSHIMLEAYKKYILVSLILHGKVQPLPKYTSQIVGRFIKVRTSRTQRYLNHSTFVSDGLKLVLTVIRTKKLLKKCKPSSNECSLIQQLCSKSSLRGVCFKDVDN